jgi:hypothetical protein
MSIIKDLKTDLRDMKGLIKQIESNISENLEINTIQEDVDFLEAAFVSFKAGLNRFQQHKDIKTEIEEIKKISPNNQRAE